MTRPSPLYALLAAFLFLPAASSLAQSASSTAPSPLPYSQDPISEITKLKPYTNSPRTLDDLKAIQARVEAVAKYALPAIVNVVVSDGQGSGVIVSKDGYVLTAGHVSGTPRVPIFLRLSNGTLVSGVTLGANDLYDSGMVKITTPGDYPFMPLGSTAKLTPGQWVVAMGHPDGYQSGRPPVLRLGKVLANHKPLPRSPEWYLQTDCPLIMGDSGGPVFDLDGRVIAINSRIGINSTTNVHVPVDTYVETWDRLARGDQWGGGILARFVGGTPAVPSTPPKATLSLKPLDQAVGVLVLQVSADKAAERAGIQAEDVITRINGENVKTTKDLQAALGKFKPGDTVTLDLLRNTKPVQVKVTLDASDPN
jgi:serine protease Do